MQLVPDALAEAAGKLDAFLDAHMHGRNEGDDVGRAHARMLAGVMIHIDQLSGPAGQLKGGLKHGLRRTDHGQDGTVVAAVGLRVEQGAAGDALRRLYKGLKAGGIAGLAEAEIRDALYKLQHVGFLH